MNSKDFGSRGEEIAVDHLIAKGYTILERNYFFQKAEVDIIARKDHFIIAIEVKTRSSNSFGDPQDFLKPRQIERIVKAMDHYVTSNQIDLEVRFDIIAILKGQREIQMEHFENAFFHF